MRKYQYIICLGILFSVAQQGFSQATKSAAKAIISKVAAPAVKETFLHLGRYDLFSGIPTVYLGHLVLLADGKYKLAFGTDEENYENGKYIFHPETDTIEWLSGMFKRKDWDGKLTNKGTSFRIEFAKNTYAETN